MNGSSEIVNPEFKYSYMGHFLPEDDQELVSIVRTTDFMIYEYWNETLGVWRVLTNDSFGERHVRIHDVRLEESWARAIFPNAFL
jgi:hypothetical protein